MVCGGPGLRRRVVRDRCHGLWQRSGDIPELAGEYISCHTADIQKGTANGTPTTPKDDWLMGGRRHAGNYGTVYSLHQFNEKDLRAVCAFLKSMGPKGPLVYIGTYNARS
ncbi:MAG: hypothetical protein HGA45_14695 [Chloroflexales bacterium]|nr:hypothetical protein [Chloroflexales bacterium]